MKKLGTSEEIYNKLKKQVNKPFTEDRIVNCFPPNWRKEVIMWKTFRDINIKSGECNYLAYAFLSHVFRIEVKHGIINNVVISLEDDEDW